MSRRFYRTIFLGLISLFSILSTFVVLESLIRLHEKFLSSGSSSSMPKLKDISSEIDFKEKVKQIGISQDTYNIYYFGESSMWGEPYQDTIPKMVEKMVGGQVDGKKLKWINMASPGISFSTVKYRIDRAVSQKQFFLPSLIVVYAGHDEFLRFQDDVGFSFSDGKPNIFKFVSSHSRLIHKLAGVFKLYKLEVDDRSFFDTPVVSQRIYHQVLNEFDDDVHSVVASLHTNNIPLIISTVPSNFSDFEPNRSVYTSDVSQKNDFKEYLDSGRIALEHGDSSLALSDFLAAQLIDNKFAEVNFRLGQTYQAMGKYDLAWQAYSDAVDNDKMPMRAVTQQNNTLRNIPQDAITKVIDSLNSLREKSENTLIGDNFFADGHHPNLTGFRLISELFAKKIVELYPKTTTFSPLEPSVAESMFIPENSLYDYYLSRADWLIRISTWRYDPSSRLAAADGYLDKANKLNGSNYYWYLSKMTIAYLRHHLSEAKEFYEIAHKMNPQGATDYLGNVWIKQVITRGQLPQL